MEYYLLTGPESFIKIGETSTKVFYPDHGWDIIKGLIEEGKIDEIDLLKIKDSKGKEHTVAEFVSMLSMKYLERGTLIED